MKDRIWDRYPRRSILGSLSVILFTTIVLGPTLTEAAMTELVSDSEPVADIARKGGGFLGFLISSIGMSYLVTRRW